MVDIQFVRGCCVSAMEAELDGEASRAGQLATALCNRGDVSYHPRPTMLINGSLEGDGSGSRVGCRGSMIKPLARYVLTRPPINNLLVGVLDILPNNPWRARVPVVGKAAPIKMGERIVGKMRNASRCDVARELYWGRGNLHHPADRIALSCAVELAKEAELFIDVGAYTGLFSLATTLVNRNLNAVAYEIVPENFQLLCENIIANDLICRIEPRMCGVGREPDTIKVPPSLGAGLLASSVTLNVAATDGVSIPVKPLDELHDDFLGRAVIKIDVECFEWPVLQGAEHFIQRNKPDIICEVLRRAPDIPSIESFMRSYGYRIFHITATGLQEVDKIVPDKSERDWLLTCRGGADVERLMTRLGA
jgi:FkbM family methyltransferase